MERGRARNLGTALGAVVEAIISKLPESEKKQYSERFFRELGDVSLAPRKKCDPPLEGVNELEGVDISELDLFNEPEHLAKIMKEAAQIGYNWRTKRNIITGIHDHHEIEPDFTQDKK